MLPWLILTLALGSACLLFAFRLPQMDRRLNEMYEQQAAETGLEKPQMTADSGPIPIAAACVGILFWLGGGMAMLKVLRPQTSRMGKSLMRYARYEGEGDPSWLFAEAEADLAHAAVFGDIAVGKVWIAGRSFPPGGQAVRLSRLCGVYCFTESHCRRGASGIHMRDEWCHLYLFDERKRQTELITKKESDGAGAFHMLLRHNENLLHGGEKEYCDFCDLPDEKQERLLSRVAVQNYEQTYYGGNNHG